MTPEQVQQEYNRLLAATETTRARYEAYYRKYGKPSERLGKLWDQASNAYRAFVRTHYPELFTDHYEQQS